VLSVVAVPLLRDDDPSALKKPMAGEDTGVTAPDGVDQQDDEDNDAEASTSVGSGEATTWYENELRLSAVATE
jgi:hypothetical protein